jgi:hypothetical protein
MEKKPFKEFFAETTGLPEGEWHCLGDNVIQSWNLFCNTAAKYFDYLAEESKKESQNKGEQ